MTAQENLARVMQEAERHFDNCLTSDEWLGAAAAVVAFLTSDDAVEAGMRAWVETPIDTYADAENPALEWSRARMRAAILAACGVES